MRPLTPQDACNIINLVYEQATGQKPTIQATDTSSFVSVGEQLLASGKENTLNALSIVLGRTFMASRPYSAIFNIIEEKDSNLYNTRMRRISFYSKKALQAGDWNTNLKTNFAEGYDNGSNGGVSTASMWEQHNPIPAEFNFAGQSVWQHAITLHEYQLEVAFRSPEEFNAFVAGILQENANDIESEKEAFNRMTFLNYMAGIYDMSSSMKGSVVNLTSEFNSAMGTSFTSQQLRTTYLKDFLEFMVSRIKADSKMMRNRSSNYHWPVDKTINSVDYEILRNTGSENQRLVMYNPIFIDAEARVLPEIFNPDKLKLQYEGVDFWQNINSGAAIDVTPAIPDVTDPTKQKAGSRVQLDYVVGCLFDKEACMVHHQLESAAVTPLEARRRYRNSWLSFSKNAINDFTFNGILYVMADA